MYGSEVTCFIWCQDARGLAMSWTTFNIRFTLRCFHRSMGGDSGTIPESRMETSHTKMMMRIQVKNIHQWTQKQFKTIRNMTSAKFRCINSKKQSGLIKMTAS